MEQPVDRAAFAAASRDPLPCAVTEPRSPEVRTLETAKIAALAEFAAGAGHEINNPLGTIVGRVQMLLRDETDGNRRQALATIGAQAVRIRDMIGDLMLFARPPVPEPKRIVLNEIVPSVADRFEESAGNRGLSLTVRIAGTVLATADPTQFCVVLSELVRNSIDAAAPGGAVEIGAARATVYGTPCAVLSVADNGSGLSEKDREHLFDPFYSGREAGRGLGFGLCKCWRIVANHRGWIDVESAPRLATTVRVFWPDDPSVGPGPAAVSSSV